MTTETVLPLDPEAVDAIEAVLLERIYDARRAARRQLLGDDPAPVASARAVELLRRARARPDTASRAREPQPDHAARMRLAFVQGREARRRGR